MKVIVSSSGSDMDSSVSQVFGRAEYYILADTDDLSHEALENPATGQSSGAGVMAAQFVLEQAPGALISSNIGPNAFQVLSAGSVECFAAPDGTVKEAVEAFSRGELTSLSSPNARSHSGTAGRTGGHEPRSGSGNDLERLAGQLRDLRGQVAEIVQQIDSLTKEQ